jgi:hypothetical protein
MKECGRGKKSSGLPSMNWPLRDNQKAQKGVSVKARICMLAGAWALLVGVAALAQTAAPPAAGPPAAGPAPSPPPSVAPRPVVTDETQPSSVTTPSSDVQINAAGQPLAPKPPGLQFEPRPVQPGPGAQVQPIIQGISEEAVVATEGIAEAPLRRRWRIAPVASFGVAYDDNIFLSGNNRVADLIWSMSAGFTFELGDFRGGYENYLNAGWIGIPVIYTNNPEQNAFNQNAYLGAQYRWTKLVATFNGAFSVVKGPNREVSAITTTTNYSNSLRFGYDYSEKTGFNLEFRQSASLSDTFQNQKQYEARIGMDYQLFPKTRVGSEVVGGILDATGSPFQYFQQLLGRTTYEATQKLHIKFSGGMEFREFVGGQPSKVSPVFRLGVEYTPFDGTFLSLAAYRNIVASTAFAGQDLTATGFEIVAQQRLFQKFIAGISVGYENDNYFGTTVDTLSKRVDDYLFLRPKISYTFIEWLSASVFYEFRQTQSSLPGSSFYDNRFGMELATRF